MLLLVSKGLAGGSIDDVIRFWGPGVEDSPAGGTVYLPYDCGARLGVWLWP
jgi:hypothetical protein